MRRTRRTTSVRAGKTRSTCFLGVHAEEVKKQQESGDDPKSRKEKSREFFPDAKGKRAKIPAGANITFDQSKM